MTKKQIKALRDAITGAWVTLADMGLREEVFSAALPEKRLEIVRVGLQERIAWNEEHARKYRESAEHFEKHPHVYGDATPEMVEQFRKASEMYDKGAAWFRILLELVEAQGLPEEVESFDPTEVRS